MTLLGITLLGWAGICLVLGSIGSGVFLVAAIRASEPPSKGARP